MRRGIGRAGPSNLPVPKASRGSPSSSLARGRSNNHARSAEDLSRSGGSNLSVHSSNSPRRALSPGNTQHKALSPMRNSQSGAAQAGVRYITEDLIRKMAKEDNLDMITSLNLTLTREGGKKIKYIENLDKVRKLQVLNLSHNAIERIEKLDKLLRLRELNLSHNFITRIEGLENLTGLQVLNLSSNNIEHIPVWLPKKLMSLRTFKIADNQVSSLAEVGKLKTLPDLIQLEVHGNPLSELPHSRLYLIFHLRCVEILDGQGVTATEREKAHNRFALDEVQNLERQLEKEETKYRQLEESHNRSEHERSVQETSQQELRQREREAAEQLKQLQQELAAKDDLLKRKTADLNKACEKHYQLEQELAFYKIDSKFQSLGEAPPPPQDLSSDDGGLLGESPYIGRARYHANRMAEEGHIVATPQRAQVHSLRAPAPLPRSISPQPHDQLHVALDAELEKKKREVEEAEQKLRSLQQNLSSTEQKLLHATHELKKLAPGRNTPEPFRDDSKYKIRQRLAKKMQTVNEMRDQATQMEDEIDRIQVSISEGRTEINKLKSELQGMDRHHPAYQPKQKQLIDREQQVNHDHAAYGQLQHDLEHTLQTIATETADIKRLEEQLAADQIEQNEELKSELDDIMTGLSGYLEGVKGQSMQHRQEFQMLLEEKEALEEKIRRLEAELSILDSEAHSAKVLQKQLEETERELTKVQNLSDTLQEDLHRSRQRDLEVQDRLEQAENEAKRLNQSLAEAEKKAQMERQAIERQLQTERERMEKMTQRVQDANRQDLEAKKLQAQLEAAKALNASLRDQLEDVQQQQQQQDDSFKPSELKKRLRKFTHDFKTNKSPGEPVHKDDFLGASFKEIYQTAQDKLNKSMRELEENKKARAKAEAEIQTAKEKLKHMESQISKQDNKKDDEEKKRLQEEVKRLQASLKQLKEGGVPVRIVYAPSDGSVDRASSLDSEEKQLFDELQRELMELKRYMRQQEQENSRKLTEAETEAAHWQKEMQAQQKQFEEEIDRHRQEAELLREKQEARIQVIAQDLDNAQYVADTLQQALNEREMVLQDELGAADMSNQMISAQEEELARLYDILEAQRSEIENLNQMLDYLATQGPDGVGPNFDDELWRIRQEVNRLKETLAMQSAYVQAMPAMSSFGAQAGFPPPLMQSSGAGGGPGLGVVGSGLGGVGVGVGAGGTGVPRRPFGGSTASGSRPPSGQPARSGFSTGMPFKGSAAAGNRPASQPTPHGSGSSSMHQRQAMGGRPHSAQMSRSGQSSGMVADPRTNFMGHLANERRESKAPLGSRSTAARPGVGTSAQQARPADQVISGERPAQRMADRSRRTAPIPTSSAFEPVHRPEPFNPLSDSPARAAPVSGGFVPQLSLPGSIGMGSSSSPMIRPSVAGVPFDGVSGSGMMGGGGRVGRGPSRGMQTSGTQGPSRSAQTGVGGGYGGGVSPGGVSSGGQQPVVVQVPVPVYVDGNAAPPPPQPAQAFAPILPAGGLPLPLQSVFPDAGVQTAAPGYGVPPGGQQVAFDPIATQYSYTDGGAGVPMGTQPYPSHATQTPPGMYNVGSQAYYPVGPAQRVAYQHPRSYVPAGSDGGRNARIYYPAGAPIPMPAPGAPPPPPPMPVTVMGPPSPGPVMASGAATPMATGTPVRGGHAVPVNFDGSFATNPPSPIRPVGMESPTRGILKNGGSGGVVNGGGDDSYLFCNVPEHHDLEDYIAELQEKLKRLKAKLFQEKELKQSLVEDNDKKLIKRLLGELEDRRDELEGLDLAIERQKRNLKEMKREERSLKREHKDARGELEKLRDRNIKKLIKISRRGDDDSFDEAMERNRQKYLQDELECLERTLAKRQTQLREAERALKDTNADLKEAKEQARETVKRYDEATSNLHHALTEHQEIDRRSNEVGLTLVKSMDQLAQVKAELKELERKRHKQERLLKDINQVIAKKDTEFRDLDGRVKAAQQNLDRIQEELSLSTQREKETVDALRDSEDILSKRRAEIARMREQVDSQRAELERLDQQLGRKRTEVQLLQENQDRRQSELNSLLRQAEAELTAKQREIKEEQVELDQLDGQKADIIAAIKAKRSELHKVQEEVQQEEEVLQRLTSSVNKNKSELKHTYEMQKLEQNELENLRAQHAQKMADLEKAQRELLEEKSELEQLNAETSRKAAELDRLRQSLEKERADVDALTSERQSLEERIAALVRERGTMEESCRNLDDKLNTMKRTQRTTEEKLEVSSRRLETLEEQLTEREREMEDANLQRTILQKDLQMLKHNIKESQTELEQLRENICDAEAALTNLRQDLRSEQQKRDDAHVEAQRLGDAIRQSSAAYEEAARQERAKQEQLQDLIRSIEDREREHEDARKALNRLRKEIEKEENKLNKLVSNANSNLEKVREDLMAKQEELDKTAQTLDELKREASQLHASGEQFAEMQKRIQELEKEMEERNKEKNELANALSVSYEEVQRLRKESSDAHDKMRKEHREFENSLSDIQQQLEQSRQELHQVQERSAAQVTELQTLAEKQFKRANSLSEELDKCKRELVEAKKQAVQQLSDDKENQRVSRRAAAVLARDSVADDWNVKHDRLRERLVEEQDYLRYQLQQQMARHNEMMDSARKKSEETINHLKRKLNSLQEVLFNSERSDIQAIRDMTRSRSQSPRRFDRHRSPSPLTRSGHSFASRSRSRSFERIGSPMIPERDFL